MILDNNGRPKNDFEFSDALKHFFRADKGAGSIIGAGDEGKKRQITVTQKFERPLIEEFFIDIPTGKKDDLGDDCLYEFLSFPDGNAIRLPLLYRPDSPGRPRNELRLYMNQGKLRPNTGMYWLVFVRDARLWLASMTAQELINIELGELNLSQNGLVIEPEEDYQAKTNSADLPDLVTSISNSYRRDPAIAKEALHDSGHTCEIFPDMATFISKATTNPYLEAHHLVPISKQGNYESSLDVVNNICILNPYAHKMVHHATYGEIEDHITNLAARREEFLNTLDLSVDDVLRIYGGP